MNPALTEEWHAGAHGQKGVNCYDCHRAEKTDVDAFEHNGATISVIVSPKDCGRCHQKEVDQQKGSHHAKAGENRAKSDGIDAELLLRTLLAWLRGEPRACSMVPIPDETDEVPDGVFASGPNSSPSASV
jgi:Cytochrome c554 and c-prime